MADRNKIGLREVRGLGPGKITYDSAVPGFAARRQKDRVSYVLRYRTAGGRQRWYTIGAHGAPWSPDMARDEARRLLGEVVRGVDPASNKQAARKAVTVAELCASYWADATSGRLLARNGRPKKASTLKSDFGRIERHVKPILGGLPVAALTRRDIEQFMHAVAEGKTAMRAKIGKQGSRVRGGRGVAKRTVSLFSAIMNYAVERGLRPDNPARGIRTFAENRRERRLSDEEYAALGCALRLAAAASYWPPATLAIRFLAVTGWRSGEALTLHWKDVDLTRRTAILADTKTGRSMRPLSLEACDLLQSVPRIIEQALVFPGSRGDGTMTGFRSFWNRVTKLGSLPPDVTPHVLRHSFASLAGDLGYSEPVIAVVIGHRGRSVTSRYIHSADRVLLETVDTVARETTRLMGETRSADVLPLRARV
jgi:integrase